MRRLLVVTVIAMMTGCSNLEQISTNETDRLCGEGTEFNTEELVSKLKKVWLLLNSMMGMELVLL